MDHEREKCPLKKLAALGKVPPGAPELLHPRASSVLLLTSPGSSPQPCSEQGNHLPSSALEDFQGPGCAGDRGEDVSEPHEVAELREQGMISGP